MSKKIFIDGGGHFGEGLISISSRFAMDKDWIIHTFEPNPAALVILRKTVSELSSKLNISLHEGALLDSAGLVDFSVQVDSTDAGSVDCLMNKGVCDDKNSISYRPHDTIIKVNSTDIAELIDQYNDADLIILKLDAEGSEFKIIRRLLETNKMHKISELFIEWHDIYLKSESESTRIDLESRIIATGTKIHVWG